MKHPLLILLVACLWCWAPLAQLRAIPLTVFLGGSPPSDAGAGYLIFEGFEGTGTPTDWITSGTVDFDYTTYVYEGAQSLSVASNSYGAAPIGDQTNVWAYSKMYWTTRPSANTGLLSFRLLSSNKQVAGFGMNGSSQGVIYSDGTISSGSTYTFSNGVWYHVLLHFQQNATCSAWAWPVADGPTKPTVDGTGGMYLTKAGGAADIADQIRCGRGATGTNITYDDVRVSTTEITP